MASVTSESPPVELYADYRQSEGCRPSPLRIIKRRQCSSPEDRTRHTMPYYVESARVPSEDHASSGSLKVRKKRDRQVLQGLDLRGGSIGGYRRAVDRPIFWKGSAELERSRKWLWRKGSLLNRGSTDNPKLSVKRRRTADNMSESATQGVGDGADSPSNVVSSLQAGIPWREPSTPKNTSTITSNDGFASFSSGTCFGSAETCRVSQPSPSLTSATPQNHLPYVLSPYIAITEESTGLHTDQRCIWAAIEVTGRLCQTATTTSNSSNDIEGRDLAMPMGSFIDHELDRFFEYGCLYNLTVEVLPATGTSVVQVLREQPFPTTIYAGSSLVVLTQIRFDSVDDLAPQRKRNTHTRQLSEELIEDLEIHLGNSSTNYMDIRVTYSHSAFPEFSNSNSMSGISTMSSTMETIATATLARHNTASPWSPRPSHTPDRLFQLMETHWGFDKATEAMNRIASQSTTPQKETDQELADQTAVNTKQTRQSCFLDDDYISSLTETSDTVQEPLRTTSEHITSHTLGLKQAFANVHLDLSLPCRSRSLWAGHDEVNESTVQKKRSFGANALKNLAPSVMDLALGVNGWRGKTGRVTAEQASDKKESTIFGWGSWF